MNFTVWSKALLRELRSNKTCWTGRCYLGQPAASSSRFIWQTTHAPQHHVIKQSLQMEPRMPSIRRTLVRIAITPPGTAHGTQQCSPMRWDKLAAQHRGHSATRTQFLQSSVHPSTPVFQSRFPVVTWVVPPLPVTCLVTTVVVVCDIFDLVWTNAVLYALSL